MKTKKVCGKHRIKTYCQVNKTVSIEAERKAFKLILMQNIFIFSESDEIDLYKTSRRIGKPLEQQI
jgi:uncharacterized protein (DUF2235 family)